MPRRRAHRAASTPLGEGRAQRTELALGVVAAACLALAVLPLDAGAEVVALAALGAGTALLALTRVWCFVVPFLLLRPSLDVLQGGDATNPVVGVAALSGAALLGVAAVFLLSRVAGGRTVRPSATAWSMCALAGAALLSALGAQHPRFALEVASRIVLVAVALVFLEELVRERPDRSGWLAAAIVASAVVPIVVALAQIPARSEVDRVTGTFLNANTLATFLTVALPLAVALRPVVGAWTRLALTGLSLLGGVAMVFTLSRGAAIGLLVALAVIGVMQQPRLLAAVALAVAVSVVWVPSVGERVRELEPGRETVEQQIAGVDPNSFAFRQRFWLQLVYIANESMVIGHGIGMTEDVISQGRFGEVYRYEPHNIYIQALVEMGALGVLALGSVIVCGARDLRRSLKCATSARDRAIVIAAIATSVALLLQGLSDNVLTAGVLMVHWAALMACASVRSRPAAEVIAPTMSTGA
jgi:O-antigen ligase